MSKELHTESLSATLEMSEWTDGWWLWDETREMNLAMRAKTRDEALVDALTYYQEHLTEVENRYRTLKGQVDAFVVAVGEGDDE